MPQQIDDQRPCQPLEQPAELRPDAGECGHRRKQPVEDGGTQGRFTEPSFELTARPVISISMSRHRQERPVPAPTDLRRKRLLFRSWHRGTRETDLILGRFADAHLDAFDDGQLDRFEALLECEDADLFDWVSGRTAPPAAHDHDVMRLLLAFRGARRRDERYETRLSACRLWRGHPGPAEQRRSRTSPDR